MAASQDPDNHASEAEDQLPALQTYTVAQSPEPMMLWSSGEENEPQQLRIPPPHLAKRFYRPGINRRRSSAASSRRNSITSSQSHASNRSYRTSLHRSAVAQHLRRASILEDRKARLQDRAAHAEQVRLRAALAKAVPRVTNTEEKALAAQQAREKHLAKVAAACAEEVSRSKRIAEENKERKAAEERRYRQELEEKHAEAERRRLGYRRNCRRARTTSQANAEDAKGCLVQQRTLLTEDQACLRIQQSWRKSRRRRIIEAFQRLELSIDRIGQITFEEAMYLLNDPDVITRTGITLDLLGLDTRTSQDTTPTRTLLSAFMMLGQPNVVFSKNGEQEQDLMSKAKDVVISLETVISEYTSSTSVSASATHLQTLRQSYAAYTTSFAAWKSRDASALVETMVDQFVALDAIWQTVKDDTRGEVASDYKTGIRDQQVMLYSKIKKLAGPERGDSLIKRAINHSRRQRSRRRPLGEVRPRQIEQASADTAPQSSISEVTAEDAISGQPPSQQSDLSRVFSVVPPNREVVHNLMIDPYFRVEPSPESDVRSALNRSICDNMRRGIVEGQAEVWTVAVAENIRARLLKLLREGSSLHGVLSEVLDPEHIRSQCRNGQFSYDKFFVFMADLLPRLCAPIRDDEVKSLADVLKDSSASTDAMVEKLFGLLHVIDLISLDHTNYLIQERAQLLIREGAGYEQRMFQIDLEGNQTNLERTTRWWRNASLNLITESNIHDPEPSPQRPSFNKLYARGLVDLVFGVGGLRKVDLPETLAFDLPRLTRIRGDIQRFVTVGGILLTVKNILKRDVRSQWKPEAKRALDALQVGSFDAPSDLSARIAAIVGSGRGMPAASREQLDSIIARFLSEASTGQLRDPVLKLLLQRLRGHVFNRLAAQSSVERVRVASTTSEGLANIGLGEFIGQIGACTEELAKIMQVDVECHGVWLRRLAEEAEHLGIGQTPGVA